MRSPGPGHRGEDRRRQDDDRDGDDVVAELGHADDDAGGPVTGPLRVLKRA